MPMLDFECQNTKCGAVHDHLISSTQIDNPEAWPPCDDCGSKTERKLFGFKRFSDGAVNHSTLGLYINWLEN